MLTWGGQWGILQAVAQKHERQPREVAHLDGVLGQVKQPTGGGGDRGRGGHWARGMRVDGKVRARAGAAQRLGKSRASLGQEPTTWLMSQGSVVWDVLTLAPLHHAFGVGHTGNDTGDPSEATWWMVSNRQNILQNGSKKTQGGKYSGTPRNLSERSTA